MSTQIVGVTCTIRMMDFVEFIGDGKPVEIRYRPHNTVRYDTCGCMTD
ncbi:MAG: hypothetical protein KIG18_06745 [Candidatus Methanomethylophilaceae archaeon]|nr:hypothetical protein [Candidatus Methanomethylophilaceae archaeon]MCI6024560.1 hypothetical protein [Methanomassiliicoccales archaeon]MDY4580200.1 hypothetical protein [Candidatus Methanarcanum hacksteinii]